LGLKLTSLNEDLAALLIERTMDPRDESLRAMTRDLSRFSTAGRLTEWLPGHDIVCLQDAAGSLLGVVWVVRKALPERSDYLDPESIRKRGPQLTWAIRTYNPARGQGLAAVFAENALDRLLSKRGEGRSLWYQTKADNKKARSLGRRLGFAEVSGEADGTVVGIRLNS
jgi:GNAT superfamily N-acetyltransferase